MFRLEWRAMSIGLAIAICVAAGCQPSGSTIFVKNEVDRDLVFRILANSGVRDYLVPRWRHGTLIVLPPGDATDVVVLDPVSCEVFFSEALPGTSTAINVVYPQAAVPEMSLSVASKRNIGDSPPDFPEFAGCKGR